MPLKAESEPRFEIPRHFSTTVPDREERDSQLSLHRAVGNQAMQALLRSGAIRAKLAISDTNDPAEREAESVAARIMDPAMAGIALPGAVSRNSPALRRSPAGHNTPANVSGIVERVLHSAGRPLDRATQGFFESRFGQDFSQVRIHTGSEEADSARSISALAYSAGEHIVFDSGQYAPHSEQGRRLLAHELTHVVQGAGGSSLAEGNSQTVVRRQPGPAKEPPPPTEIEDTPANEKLWRTRVDEAVRAAFDLGGSKAGLTASDVTFLSTKKFEAQFSRRELRDELFDLFWTYGNEYPGSVPGLILHIHAGHQFELPPINGYGKEAINEVIDEGMRKGSFWYHSLPTIDERGTQEITPRDLVAMYVWGTTDMSGPREKHKIKVQLDETKFLIDVLVHEACHFYIHDAFKSMVAGRKDGDHLLGGAKIKKILFEGFAEFFARRVMKANEKMFGTIFKAYPLEVEQVGRLAATLGEDHLEAAYFHGDALQLKRLGIALDKYKSIPLDQIVSAADIDMPPAPPHK